MAKKKKFTEQEIKHLEFIQDGISDSSSANDKVRNGIEPKTNPTIRNIIGLFNIEYDIHIRLRFFIM